MSFSFRPAVRESVSLLIGLSGGTGSGKTYSAMRLAHGIAGDQPFAVIDTEAGRAKHYADRRRLDLARMGGGGRHSRLAGSRAAADGWRRLEETRSLQDGRVDQAEDGA
jgi:hypothetical protein